MAWFSARNISVSTVPVDVGKIWSIVTDPAKLAALTPLVSSITESGSHWTWTLSGIEGLGLKVEPVFTERMRFEAQRQIVFEHDPPEGVRERASVEGAYELTPVGDESTRLHVDLTLSVDLPLPGLDRPAVQPIMHQTMRSTGHRFAVNLYEMLGLDPSTVEIEEIET